MKSIEDVDGPSQDGPVTNLLVGSCGAANVVNLPNYLGALRELPRYNIRVVMTASAAGILPARTVGLLCDAVFADGIDGSAGRHVELARWADKVVVLPTTAHMLGQVACGLAGSLLATCLLAFEGPIIFFPSMNGAMWEQASVQRNVDQIRADGHVVVDPVRVRCWEIASASVRWGPGLLDAPALAALVQELPGRRVARHE